MTVLINPGSRVPDVDNTYERAQQYAREWLNRMTSEGFGDIEFIDTGEECEGRWLFLFRHKVTGVQVKLEQHGVAEDTVRNLIFAPRVYWNGSSSAVPNMDNFAAPGFVITFRREAS